MSRLKRVPLGIWAALVLCVLYFAGSVMGQLQVSGSPSVTVSNASLAVTQSGNWSSRTQDGAGTAITSTSSALDINIKSGSIGNTAFALNAGSALVGFVMAMPSGCSGSGSSLVVHNTVGVATGAGTSVSSVTGCVVECFVNNITNSSVTLRIADKTGTPIIWVGGAGDFSLLGNSNIGCGNNGGMGLAGVIMTSGITAIAGTSSALNLHLVTRE